MADLLAVIVYIVKSFFEGNTHFKRLRVNDNRKLHLLANGPSLSQFLDNMDCNPLIDNQCDYIAVNDFINDNRCLKIRPKYYVLSDPLFLYDTIYKERGLRVMNNLADRVDWDMTLFVRFNAKDSEFLPILLRNSHIKIEYYHSYHFPIFCNFHRARNFLYKKGIGNGEYSTVALNALYIGITIGYKQIFLQGVDHTFFNGLLVNDENIPCYVYKHSFDKSEEVKPMIFHYDKSRKYKDMPYFLYEMFCVFRGHWIMAEYANYMGAKVLNCTEGSLIDAYPRLKR